MPLLWSDGPYLALALPRPFSPALRRSFPPLGVESRGKHGIPPEAAAVAPRPTSIGEIPTLLRPVSPLLLRVHLCQAISQALKYSR